MSTLPEGFGSNRARSEQVAPKRPPTTVGGGRALFPKTSLAMMEELQSPDDHTRVASLEKFCAIYYASIFGLARRMGMTPDDAKDRAQDFFFKIVNDGMLQKFEVGRGTRLSTWLIKCFRNMVSKHHEARDSKRRGGGIVFVDLDTIQAEEYHQYLLDQMPDAEVGFDMTLAQQIWAGTQIRLREKHQGKSSEALAEALTPYILPLKWPPPPSPSQSELAATHGVSNVTLKAFFNHTLRRQARKYFQQESADHCQHIANDEVEHLWQLLRSHASV